MSVTVAVLIPFRPDGEERTANLMHVLARWVPTGWQVSVADDGDPDGPWCKARAVARAHRSTPADVYVVADADVFCPTPAVEAAVRALEGDLSRPWAMPHRLVRRLDANSTRHVLAGRQANGVSRSPYEGFEGGGMTVLTAAALAGCPLDPRFVGWGTEDEAWGMALRCLYGEPWRGDAQLIHLWHPDAPEKAAGARRSPRDESKELLSRYRLTKAHPDGMRAILAEVT